MGLGTAPEITLFIISFMKKLPNMSIDEKIFLNLKSIKFSALNSIAFCL